MDLSYPAMDPNVTCPGVCGAACNWGYETSCDMGTDDNGCWLGNYCMNAMYQGANNATCYEMCPAICDWETETTADYGYDESGCWMGNYCVPMNSTFGNSTDNNNTCPEMTYTACSDNQTSCHNGFGSDGCDLGFYCIDLSFPAMDPNVTCPGVCGASCNWGSETTCEWIAMDAGWETSVYLWKTTARQMLQSLLLLV